MQLLLFDDINSWVQLECGVKIKVDYCNIVQKFKLDNLIANYADTTEEKSDEERNKLLYMHAYYTIKFHLKDWEGVGKSGEESIELKLKDNEVEDSLMNAIANNTILFWQCYNSISSATKFDTSDKKK